MTAVAQRTGSADGAAPRVPEAPPRDASMSLLATLMTDTLDDGYAQATERARASGRPAGGLRGSPLLLLGLLAVGLLLATAAVRERGLGAVQEGARAALTEEVRERTGANDRLGRAVAGLRTDLAGTRADALALTGAGAAAARRLERLEAATGVGPVSGPGVVLTLDDAPAPPEDDALAGEAASGATDPGRVRDGDLQEAVNGLWRAGAEAVSVDGQRLTALTAIRSAGEAVLVAYRPLAPPYEIAAVGDPAALEVGFLDSDAGLVLQALEENYGIRSDLRRAEDLDLPGAPGTTLRLAAVPGQGR
jgi:uncharacterized protein YlxW (UPF0749 family)